MSILKNYFLEHRNAFEFLQDNLNEFEDIFKNISKAINYDKKRIFIAGNGGSAADAQHFAAELIGRFQKERLALPAIALTTNTSSITAIANDYGYDYIFSRQLSGLAEPGDIFIGLSTSGKSKNILHAMNYAKNNKILSIFLTGNSNDSLENLADYVIEVPSSVTSIVQEMHIFILHSICKYIDQNAIEIS